MRLWMRPARIAIVATSLLSTTVAGQPDRVTDPVTLAVVRADGLLIPFASWTGKTWENSWPVPEKSADTPITTADIPKRWWARQGPVEEWQVWQVDGSRTPALVKRPTWYLAHCQQGVGLATNLDTRKPLPPPVVQPYPKVGLASSSPLRFQPIAVMGPESSVWKAIPAAIRDHVDAEEARIVKGLLTSAQWRHPVDPEARRPVPIEVQALYRSPTGDGRFIHYFEAVKRYTSPEAALRADEEQERGRRRRPGEDCAVITFASGWFVAGNSDTRVSTRVTDVRITSCDFEDVDVMLPLGYLSSAEGPLWIIQLSGWGREAFRLLRWNAATGTPDLVFSTPGGECARIR